MVEPMNISGFQPPALPFPAKVKSERRAAPARTLPIKVNGYALDLSHAVPFVEKFELGIHLKLERGDVKDATKGPRLDVALAARRRALYSIMIALYKKHPEIFGNDRHQFAYDCGRILYAMNLRAKLPEDGRGQFVVPKSEWSDHTTKFFPAAAIEMIITVQFTEEINIGEFVKHKVIKDITDENYRPIQQFLEVLTNQALIDHGDHLIFKNRIYEKGSEYDAPLVEGKVAKMGMEKNIRPIGDSPSTTSMMLQLDAKKSPFFKGQDVLKFLMEYLGCSERDLESRAHKEIRKLTAQLKDVCVETTHLEKPRQFCISRISEKGAEDTYFDLKDGGNISVYKYYQTQYQIRLHYPGLPVAEERKAGKNGVNISYHPLECLNIVKGQRVDLKKQTPKLTEGLIRQCQMLPRNLEVHVEEERKYARLTSRSKNKELDAFGVRIVDGMTVVDGKQLFGPSIRYENVSVDPRPDGIIDWKTGNREKYTKAARVNSVAVLVFDKCLDQRQAQQFIDSFFRTLESRGLRMCSTRDVEFETPYAERTEEVHNAVATYAKKKYTIVLGLTRDKLDPVHNTLKLAEQRYGIPTMHIWTQTAQKAMSPQGGMQVLSNLAMKFNEKVGGVNYSLEVSQAYARNYMAAYRTDPKSLNNSYFGARNMFVGIDVAHAPPQSFADRIEGVPPSEPTVVGFAHTVGDVMASRGWYWMQKPRLTSITSIDQNFVKALTIFKRETGSLPTSIIVYRGGVSEGEFRSVQEEALQVQGTLREFGSLNGVSNYQPYVCWLVVQTKSNYRLLPAQEMRGNRPADLNVQPGACVDTSAVHPLYNEFVLVPHKAIQGTARPIRVTEVYNEGGPKWNLDDIENVTHSLCFGLGIVCGSVSMPSPLFHATNLSKRGRNVWKEAVMDESEGTTVSSFGNAVAGRFRNDGSPDFFEKLSEVFVHHIEDKLYWA